MMNEALNRYLGVLAYPFVDISMIYQDRLQEYYQNQDTSIAGRGILRQSLIEFIQSRYSIYSYDELYLMLDRWYIYPIADSEVPSFDLGKKETSFGRIFHNLYLLTESLISHRGGKIVFKYWENPCDAEILGGFQGKSKIFFFHNINRLFPMDVLVGIYFQKNHSKLEELAGYRGDVEVSDQLLDKVLQRGIAENHLHAGTAGSFLSRWNRMMKPVTAENEKEWKNDTKRLLPKEQMKVIQELYLAARIRIELSLILREWENDHSKPLKDYVYFKTPPHGISKVYDMEQEFKALQEQEYKCAFEALMMRIKEYWNRRLDDCGIKDSRNEEILHKIFDIDQNLDVTEENLFLYKVLGFIKINVLNTNHDESVCKNDIYQYVNKWFLDYLRIKNYYYGCVVQQKGVHGLNYFQQFYGKNSNFGKVEGDYWYNVLKEQLEDSKIKRLELRCSLSGNYQNDKKKLREFISAYQRVLKNGYYEEHRDESGRRIYDIKKPIPRVGLVVHFTKREQEDLKNFCIGNKTEEKRFQSSLKQYWGVLDSIKELRMQDHFDNFLLGIDVASLENAIPTWVFTKLYENARKGQEENFRYGAREVKSLGFTMHAGEDFRHVLSGIRRIYEAVEGLKFHSGDRIGHGIALGISVKDWYRNNPVVILPRIEALENYLWAYKMLSESDDLCEGINLSYLEKNIFQLATEIYGPTHALTIQTLVSAYEELYAHGIPWEQCSNCDFCQKGEYQVPCSLIVQRGEEKYSMYHHGVHVENWNVERLLASIGCRDYVLKMQEPIHRVVTVQDIQIAECIQNLVKKIVNQKGIMIEINPTSNTVIAEIDKVSESHVYGLNQYPMDFENVLTCINSDDPSVFNTHVSNELGYIYFGMLYRGVSVEAALTWIEKLRKNGMDGSFIRDDISDEQLLKELDEILEG